MIEYCSPTRSLVLTQVAKIARESSIQNLRTASPLPPITCHCFPAVNSRLVLHSSLITRHALLLPRHPSPVTVSRPWTSDSRLLTVFLTQRTPAPCNLISWGYGPNEPYELNKLYKPSSSSLLTVSRLWPLHHGSRLPTRNSRHCFDPTNPIDSTNSTNTMDHSSLIPLDGPIVQVDISIPEPRGRVLSHSHCAHVS